MSDAEKIALLIRWICNEKILVDYDKHRGNVWQKAYHDQGEINERVMDIVFENRTVVWDHLFPPAEEEE